jgi:hypothetical protein
MSSFLRCPTWISPIHTMAISCRLSFQHGLCLRPGISYGMNGLLSPLDYNLLLPSTTASATSHRTPSHLFRFSPFQVPFI